MRFTIATIAFAGALTGLLFMTGCSSVVSLQPIVAEKDATTEAALTGTWTDEEGKDTFVVRQSGAAYTFTYVDKSGTAYKFDGRLWKIGDALLLDLVATHEAPFHLPVHFAMRIWPARDTLRMAFLDSDWFKQLVAEQLANQKLDDRTVIVATPAAIRAFFLANAGDEKAYRDPDTLHRVTESR